MLFSIRQFRRRPACCSVKYQRDLAKGQGTIWNLSLAGMALTLGALLAGCGGGEDSTSPSGPSGPTITTSSLSATETLLDYNQTIQATGGSNAGYIWSVISGALPPGIVLGNGTPTATLRGTPIQIGTFPFTLQVQDSQGQRGIRDLSIDVRAATVVFEYELWMQAQTSLDAGPISIQGKIVNTGGATLNLTPDTVSIAGIPSNLNLTTCDDPCIRQQLTGFVLAPGATFSFLWLDGTQTENISGFAGSVFSASVGLVPVGSDWTWTAAGNIPGTLVSSEWVNGPVNTSLPFNKQIINLTTVGQFMNTPTPIP